jgi:hypothetical protein
LVTRKHIKKDIDGNNLSFEIIKDLTTCVNCNKQYANRGGLWKHKQKCTMIKMTTPKNDKISTELFTKDDILDLIRQNKELQNILIEQNEKILEISTHRNTMVHNNNNNNNNSSTINNTTNQFNLNLFLNEQCKDAMNMKDFIETMQLNVSDIEETGRLGYVNGISRIFINKIKELDVFTRPLHCTDYKRETVYIKDKDTWEKENTEKSKLTKLVNQVACKNLKMLTQWQAKNPEFMDNSKPASDEYLKISLISLGAYEQEDIDKDTNKIVRNVLKEVILDKIR